MTNALIWLHEFSLHDRASELEHHLEHLSQCFIWDNQYFQQQRYSLKRLVFIYETLLELKAKIFFGNTVEVLSSQSQATIYYYDTFHPDLIRIINQLREHKNLVLIPEQPFVTLPRGKKYRRFFQYWKHAEKQLIDMKR